MKIFEIEPKAGSIDPEVVAWQTVAYRHWRPSLAESVEVAQDAVCAAVREYGRGMRYEQTARGILLGDKSHQLGRAFERAAQNLRVAGMMRFATAMVGALEPERVAEGVARRLELGAMLAASLPAGPTGR